MSNTKSDYTFNINLKTNTCDNLKKFIKTHRLAFALEFGISNTNYDNDNHCTLYFNNAIDALNIQHLVGSSFKDDVINISKINKF